MTGAIVKIGVVGAGAVATSVHLPILTRRSDLFKVCAVADFNSASANHLADRFGIPADSRFTSAHEMIASGKIDAIAIINSGSHCALVVAALNANLNVFCEKPLAYSKKEMSSIEDALKNSTGKLMIGYMKTYDPAVVRAKNLIGLKRPRSVDVLVLHPSGESQLATSEISVKAFPASPELIAGFMKDAKQLDIEALGEKAAAAFGAEYSDIILGSIVHEFSVLRALDIHISEIDHVDRWPIETRSESFIIHARTADGVRVTIRWFYLDKYPMYQEEVRWMSDEEGHHIIFPAPYILRVPTKLISTTRIGLAHDVATFETYEPSFEIELVAFHTLATTGNQKSDPIADGNEDLTISQKIASKICELEGIEKGGDI
ncbi:MAG: Gfo/Idh/MocA family oxidoreductase [Actinobacteria bacterium]|nr:Gfo/Idh/MocA family oxidoreductase [Actinomycetota bacterium]